MARVLFVDDEPLILRSIERGAETSTHVAVTADSGMAAIREIGSAEFDVAFVDHDMPSPNGLEVLKQLREIQPRCVRVLMSGCLGVPMVVNAVNRGEISRVLAKPFTMSQVLETIDDSLQSRLALERALLDTSVVTETEESRAQLGGLLDRDMLRLALQPILSAETGKTVAVEALMRSSHSILGSPIAVLGAAERTGMVPHVTRRVVELAAEWLWKLPESLKLFMNVHPIDFADPHALAERLGPLGSLAGRTVIEITERSSLLELRTWRDSIELLRSKGFALALDDLGAGYSSLATLAELEPQFIKVDMSIVRNVHRDPRKRRLVDLLCKFADATGPRLVAEGVETEREAQALRECGAHMLQGYLFGKPSFELAPDWG